MEAVLNACDASAKPGPSGHMATWVAATPVAAGASSDCVRRPSARSAVVGPRHVGCNRPAQRSQRKMRADELVVLTKAEYEELKARAGSAVGDAGELFNSEEMQ